MLKPYLHYIPNFIKAVYPNYIWHIPQKEKIVYLTFDDGPEPMVTDWILRQLKKHHAKVTFFGVGQDVVKYPQALTQILTAGHTVANHSYSHLKAGKSDLEAYIADVEQAAHLLISETVLPDDNIKPYLFRPPYGRITKKQAGKLQSLGYQIVMYNILSGDFDINLDVQKSIQKLKKHIKPGSIIVFHNSLKAFKNLQIILPEILAFLSEKDFEYKTLAAIQ